MACDDHFIYPFIVLGVNPSIQFIVPMSVPVVSNKYIKVFCASRKLNGCFIPAFFPHCDRMFLISVSFGRPLNTSPRWFAVSGSHRIDTAANGTDDFLECTSMVVLPSFVFMSFHFSERTSAKIDK